MHAKVVAESQVKLSIIYTRAFEIPRLSTPRLILQPSRLACHTGNMYRVWRASLSHDAKHQKKGGA